MLPDVQEAAREMAGRVVLSEAPGEAIRAARDRYGFTQAFLAPYLGVRRESLSRIESGHSRPNLDVVAQFARIMALAQQVRAYAARMEKNGGVPNHAFVRAVGSELDLPPEAVDEVARAALETYSAKREALLEGLGKQGGDQQ